VGLGSEDVVDVGDDVRVGDEVDGGGIVFSRFFSKLSNSSSILSTS